MGDYPSGYDTSAHNHPTTQVGEPAEVEAEVVCLVRGHSRADAVGKAVAHILENVTGSRYVHVTGGLNTGDGRVSVNVWVYAPAGAMDELPEESREGVVTVEDVEVFEA